MADKGFWKTLRDVLSRKEERPKKSASFSGYGNGQWSPIFAQNYTGEKNLGEVGLIKNWVMDYEALRLRSWQSYVENDITRIIINKYKAWVTGSKGLKLQSEPQLDVLKSEGINIDAETFSQAVEARFTVFSESNLSDYNKMRNLNWIAGQVLINAKLGGDVLILLRYGQDNNVNIQMVDGSHVVSPKFGNEWYPYELPNGNRILNGVEYSPDTNEHVAYHVRKPGLTFETQRVPAKTPDGKLTTAFLVYGSYHRIDNMRGVPILVSVLETLKKMERYKEATLGSAEERAKIVYQIVHKAFSDGESPLTAQLAKAHDYDNIVNDTLPISLEGKELANTVAVSTNKQTFNMPLGAEMKALDSKNETLFKDFYMTNTQIVCACLNVPPDVALAMYNENYSASRAAIKDWEHTLNVERYDFGSQFMKPVYKFWLHTEILSGKINAPGYLKAFLGNNWMVLEAYIRARYAGAAVPHIDPMKEVQAQRLKLGVTADAIPLTTVEAATEELGGGDSKANIEQYSKELKESESLGVKMPDPVLNKPKPLSGGGEG
jgi:capsid protein